MLNKIIQGYQNSKLATVKKFSNQDYDILDEPGFLDNGYIKMKIEGLKQDHKKLDEQINQLIQFDKRDEYKDQKIATLIEQKNHILLYMSFLASNSFNSLEFAIHLIENMKTDFALCLEALFYYKEKQESKSFGLFEKYFSIHHEPLHHFLINKIYGLLLLKCHHDEKAALFLRKAVETRPEDLKIHYCLIQVYEGVGNRQQAAIHRNIFHILGGDESGYDQFS